MNDPTVATAPSVREKKPAAELERDTWVKLPAGSGHPAPFDALIRHVEPYTDGDGVALIFRDFYDTAPGIKHMGIDAEVELLTEDEIAKVVDGERREMIAHQLERFAALIRDDLPLPPVWRSVNVNIDFGADMQMLERFAEALGTKVDVYGKTASTFLQQDGDRGAGLNIAATAFPPAASELTGQDFSREVATEDAPPANGRRVEPHTGAVTEDGLKPWESNAPLADRIAESMERIPPTHPDDLPKIFHSDGSTTSQPVERPL